MLTQNVRGSPIIGSVVRNDFLLFIIKIETFRFNGEHGCILYLDVILFVYLLSLLYFNRFHIISVLFELNAISYDAWCISQH